MENWQIFFGISTVILLQFAFSYEATKDYDKATQNIIPAAICMLAFTAATLIRTFTGT